MADDPVIGSRGAVASSPVTSETRPDSEVGSVIGRPLAAVARTYERCGLRLIEVKPPARSHDSTAPACATVAPNRAVQASGLR
ncbi:MAG TPA: hypothetical protein VGH27_07340 [Streptosporangiaceae bacterium]|jgi:hypothetical protein